MLAIARSNLDYQDAQDYLDVGIALTGRCLIPPRLELNCFAHAISPYALSVVVPAKVVVGEWVVVYLSAFGPFRGAVVERKGICFEMELQLPQAKREKLARQLDWYFERDALGLPERRLHDRIVPLKQMVVMRDGQRPQLVRIDDISHSGASISTTLPPPRGAEVILDDTPAVVVRTSEAGFACEFVRPFNLRRLEQKLSF